MTGSCDRHHIDEAMTEKCIEADSSAPTEMRFYETFYLDDLKQRAPLKRISRIQARKVAMTASWFNRCVSKMPLAKPTAFIVEGANVIAFHALRNASVLLKSEG